ncbi:MAG: Na/Pi cotransporter family protein [Spirochaetaceae bacterium]|jgi:phosphate:Na+ symporter|nr:Na/Pi cotransporter family protein [Spirochaetaceae bacterium]
MMIVSIVFVLGGSLGMLLYGMKMMSDGIQKGAGNTLRSVLGFMTGNRFFAVLTGLLVTAIVQSSGAATVMVVSFVNAGIMSLEQSAGVIFGANIGTTATAWIVSLFGFNFKISAVALPVFGIGYLLTAVKRLKAGNLGEGLMGFALLFLGLDFLSSAIPRPGAENAAFLSTFSSLGALGLPVGIFAGLLFTMLIHSSSAMTAVIITLAYNGLLTWEFSAAMVLGSNIGSTADAVLASLGTKVNARRAALIHVLFNVTGTILAALFFRPLLALVDYITPGTVEDTITNHIAMLHTVFNLLCTLLFLPFTRQIAALTERLIKPREGEIPTEYRLPFFDSGLKENTAAQVIRAEKEIADMADLVMGMFARIRKGFDDRSERFITEHLDALLAAEDYADQMKEELSAFLVQCLAVSGNIKAQDHIRVLLRVVDDLESMSDDCYSVAALLRRSIDKKMIFDPEDVERLHPYTDLAEQFLVFVREHINKRLSPEEFQAASALEDQIDAFRKQLKKVARKRLEKGADVKTELLYLDLVRNIEKIGDRAFSISEALAEMR